MSNYTSLWVYKAADHNVFEALRAISSKHSVDFRYKVPPATGDIDCRTAERESVFTLFIPYLGGEERDIAHSLGTTIGAPWCSLVSGGEGGQWGYELFNGAMSVDKFWPAPEYWSEDETFCGQYRGKPALFSSLWGGEPNVYSRYLTSWKIRIISDEEFDFSIRSCEISLMKPDWKPVCGA